MPSNYIPYVIASFMNYDAMNECDTMSSIRESPFFLVQGVRQWELLATESDPLPLRHHILLRRRRRFHPLHVRVDTGRKLLHRHVIGRESGLYITRDQTRITTGAQNCCRIPPSRTCAPVATIRCTSKETRASAVARRRQVMQRLLFNNIFQW